MAANSTRYSRDDVQRLRAAWAQLGPSIRDLATIARAIEFRGGCGPWFDERGMLHDQVAHLVRDRCAEGVRATARLATFLGEVISTFEAMGEENKRLHRTNVDQPRNR